MAGKFIQVPQNLQDPIQLRRFLSSLVTSIDDLSKSKGAVTNLNQTITDPPTQVEVQALSNKLDELLGALRSADILAP